MQLQQTPEDFGALLEDLECTPLEPRTPIEGEH
jgi:hypothetical protein